LSEYYDQLIFVNPSPEFERLVLSTMSTEPLPMIQETLPTELESADKDLKLASQTSAVALPTNSALPLKDTIEWSYEALTKESVFNEKSQVVLLEDANSFIEKQVQDLISRISALDGEINTLNQSLRE